MTIHKNSSGPCTISTSLTNYYSLCMLFFLINICFIMSIEKMRMGPIGQVPWINVSVERLYCHMEAMNSHKEWDESGHNVISHIAVSFNNNGVISIQFGYVDNGVLVMTETYGSSTAACSKRILRLKHDSEFVTGISGEVHNGYISSLTFHTNERKLETLHLTFDSGKQVTEKMDFHSGILEQAEFLGFFGSSNSSQLTFIGFYVRLMLPNVMAIKQEG